MTNTVAQRVVQNSSKKKIRKNVTKQESSDSIDSKLFRYDIKASTWTLGGALGLT